MLCVEVGRIFRASRATLFLSSTRIKCMLLQCGTGCCRVLQFEGVKGDVVLKIYPDRLCVAGCCSVLQFESVFVVCELYPDKVYVAVCCSVLQCLQFESDLVGSEHYQIKVCVAGCCSVLQFEGVNGDVRFEVFSYTKEGGGGNVTYRHIFS